MDQSLFKFDLIAEDPTTHARAGVLHTPHGDIETPIFMPVGTKANVKGIPTETVKQLGAQIVLANTYHLSMRPGEDTIAELGGLHKFMNWHGPILTDSGGFQVFSHNDAVKLTDEGVRFIVNDYDGRHVFWTPEDNMEIAMKLGSDICMQLDQCPGYPATRAYVERAVELSSMWAERCYKAHTRDDQALFGIVQGGMHLDLRVRSIQHLEDAGDFPGYGIGGYSVGEDHDTMFESLEPLCAEHMPKVAECCRDPRVPIDNTELERRCKAFATGRKNWQICDTLAGAQASACMYSRVETARANGLETRAWLEWVLEEMPRLGEPQAVSAEQVERFLPWSPDVPDRCRVKK